MGWWSREPSASAGTLPQQAPSHSEPPPPAKPPVIEPLPPSKAPRIPGRDEAAYEELKSLFAQIDPERAASAASAAAHTLANPTPEQESLYASSMSCSQCFDLAYYCSSAGGQMNNVYRYGALRSCSELWAQWRFCMRTKAMGDETKKEKIREFNREKAAKYKVGRSSEDVWEIRTEPVENAFSRKLGRLEDEGVEV